MNNSDNVNRALLKESIFIIGTVSSVEGRRVKIRVKKDKNLSHISYLGKTIKNVSVGSYVKITKGFIEIVGKVEGEYISKEKVENRGYEKKELNISRYLEVVLFGNFDQGRFQQGIKEMPLIDNEVYLLDRDEFTSLHKFYDKDDSIIPIGTLNDEPSQVIQIAVKKIFASHIGIFGNTGSGKSNTLAKIYTELFRKVGTLNSFKQNSRFVLIDFNGEYVRDNLITTEKTVYNLSTGRTAGDPYLISKGGIERLEVISVLLEATEKTQMPFLSRALRDTYFDEEFESRSVDSIKRMVSDILQRANVEFGISLFTELFSHLSQLEDRRGNVSKTILGNLENSVLKFNSTTSSYYTDTTGTRLYSDSSLEALQDAVFVNLNQLQIDQKKFGVIKLKILSRYYHEIINGYSNPEHIRPLIGRMVKKFNVLGKVIDVKTGDETSSNLEVINLKEVNLEMKKTLPLIIAKQLYDEHKEQGDFENKSLHIIIDEAHNILSSSSERESESWKDYRLETFEEIIKEGRKFSTFLTLSSQRPFDISSTIISQLHNYFIHRLINNNDINAIQKTVAYMDKLSFESIPVLPVGSCFMAGLASDIPVKVQIDLLKKEQQPKSETINLEDAWHEEDDDLPF